LAENSTWRCIGSNFHVPIRRLLMSRSVRPTYQC